MAGRVRRKWGVGNAGSGGKCGEERDFAGVKCGLVSIYLSHYVVRRGESRCQADFKGTQGRIVRISFRVAV